MADVGGCNNIGDKDGGDGDNKGKDGCGGGDCSNASGGDGNKDGVSIWE